MNLLSSVFRALRTTSRLSNFHSAEMARLVLDSVGKGLAGIPPLLLAGSQYIENTIDYEWLLKREGLTHWEQLRYAERFLLRMLLACEDPGRMDTGKILHIENGRRSYLPLVTYSPRYGIAIVVAGNYQGVYVRDEASFRIFCTEYFWKGKVWDIRDRQSDSPLSLADMLLFTEMEEAPFVNVGQIPLDQMARMTRTTLIYGRSGEGKTMLAVELARRMHATRILRISGNVLSGDRAMGMLSLVNCLCPDAMVVDDIETRHVTSLLDRLDLIRAYKLPIFLTLMTSKARIRIPGLRPGRMDYLYHMTPPTPEQRRSWLVYTHAPAEVIDLAVAETEGWSTAFVVELGRRLTDRNDPAEEIRALREHFRAAARHDRTRRRVADGTSTPMAYAEKAKSLYA